MCHPEPKQNNARTTRNVRRVGEGSAPLLQGKDDTVDGQIREAG
jgi:hypothetical protein